MPKRSNESIDFLNGCFVFPGFASDYFGVEVLLIVLLSFQFSIDAPEGLAHSLSVDGTNDGIFVPPIPQDFWQQRALVRFQTIAVDIDSGINGRPARVP